MVQWLRTLVALTEDLGSIPSTHLLGSQPSITPVAEADLLGHQAYGTHTYMKAEHTHKIK